MKYNDDKMDGSEKGGVDKENIDEMPTQVASSARGNLSSSDDRGEEFPTTLGKFYKITRKIGEGGMGVVFEVEHTKMGKKFAAKVISKSYASNADAVKRFELEAVAASKIDSPHIVQVVHLDTEGEYTYIIMELLKGKNLAQIIYKKVVPVPFAVEVAKQVAKGLIAAHEAGIVHRDLKPENIFLIDQEGQLFAKILDFGISKIKLGADANVKLTKTGQIIGTPLYFSPEQAKGIMEVDGRTDIYALGVILFEMVTGRPPFEATNPIELMMKHAMEPPPLPSKFNPDISPELENIILKCLAKNIEERYQTAKELYDDLQSLELRPPEKETVTQIITKTGPEFRISSSSRVGTTIKKGVFPLKVLLIVASACIFIFVSILGYFKWGRAGRTEGRDKLTGNKTGLQIDANLKRTEQSFNTEESKKVEEKIKEVALTITSRPEPAEVWRDGKAIGQTPFVFRTAGDGKEYEFEVRAKGFKPEKIVMTADSDKGKHVVLTKIRKSIKIDEVIKTTQ